MATIETKGTPREQAIALDAADPLARFRAEFSIPTRAQISGTQSNDDRPATYLVGNSLGLQPRRTRDRVLAQLDLWASHGVTGHFSTPATSSSSPPWVDVDEYAAGMIAPVVGAVVSEVAVMQTLSANLHLLLCAFYRPDIRGRHEILLEAKAFPSDHFVVESQIKHHGLPPSSLVAISSNPSTRLLSTEAIISTLDAYASTAAVLLLPGVQYYTGQLLDIPTITAHARRLGIVVLWDLAHAVGNVPLSLHDWDIDGAAWCGYKYLNGGPGCIAGIFLHQRHHSLEGNSQDSSCAQDRALRGWWGTAKKGRFDMDTSTWNPGHGAAGMQLSNPSVLCTTSLCASLEVFAEAGGIVPLREKSTRLTSFLYTLLESLSNRHRRRGGENYGCGTLPFEIITPTNPNRRGAQLSILLQPGMLDSVVGFLQARGVCVDERRPDVIRVAPAPLYNTFQDCCDFVDALDEALGAEEWGGGPVRSG